MKVDAVCHPGIASPADVIARQDWISLIERRECRQVAIVRDVAIDVLDGDEIAERIVGITCAAESVNEGRPCDRTALKDNRSVCGS